MKKAAAEAGDESPIVFVFLPKHEGRPDQGHARQLRRRRGHAAAADATDRRGQGRAAGDEDSRWRPTTSGSPTLFDDVVAHARVFQGGGNELTTSSLRDAVETAANRSLIRLFPKFAQGDNPNWARSSPRRATAPPTRSKPLATTASRPRNTVCKEVLAAISPGGTKGAELQKRFAGTAVWLAAGTPSTAPILTLLAAGNIRAAQDGKDLAGRRSCRRPRSARSRFYKEDEPPTVGQRLAVRGLLTAAGDPVRAGPGGRADLRPPSAAQGPRRARRRSTPLPEPPDTDHLDALLALGGNQRFRAVADDHDRLSDDLERVAAADQQREKREAEWHELQRLLRHADGLPVAAAVAPAVAAIRDGRQLLDEPDPIAPLLTELTGALRAEVDAAGRAARRRPAARLSPSSKHGTSGPSSTPPTETPSSPTPSSSPATPPDVSTDAKLLEALDATPLSAWHDRISLVPSRRDQARQRAAKKLEPESVTVTAPVGHDQGRRRPRPRTSTSCGRECSRTSTPTRP